MGNSLKGNSSPPPRPSAHSVSAQSPRALPQPLQRSPISGLPGSLGITTVQVRQVEGVSEEKKPYSDPTVEVLMRVCKTGGRRGREHGFDESRGLMLSQRKADSAGKFVFGLGQGLVVRGGFDKHVSHVECWEGMKG